MNKGGIEVLYCFCEYRFWSQSVPFLVTICAVFGHNNEKKNYTIDKEWKINYTEKGMWSVPSVTF